MLGDIRTGILEFYSDLSEDLVDKLLCNIKCLVLMF